MSITELHKIPDATEYQEPKDAEWKIFNSKDEDSTDFSQGEFRNPLYESLDNSSHLQLYDMCPYYITKFAQEKFKHWNSVITKQMPGCFLPSHQDKYRYFKEKYGAKHDVVRFNIFLQSRQHGHFLDVDGKNIADWKAGQYVILNSNLWHCSSNAGIEPKYTCQVTGILN